MGEMIFDKNHRNTTKKSSLLTSASEVRKIRKSHTEAKDCLKQLEIIHFSVSP